MEYLNEIILIFILAIIFLLLWGLVRSKYTKFLTVEDEQVRFLKLRITELENEVRILRSTQEILLEQLHKQNIIKIENNAIVARPVLLVYGSKEFGEADRNALRRAGIVFFRLVGARLSELQEEIQRRRSDGTLYDIIHFAAHSIDGGGIDLNGEIVDGVQLSNVLSGVRGVFLSTCSNYQIADRLLGVVKYVVIIYEDITNEDASNFVYEFYKRYKVERDIEASFNGAIAVLPNIAEFVDLRKGI